MLLDQKNAHNKLKQELSKSKESIQQWKEEHNAVQKELNVAQKALKKSEKDQQAREIRLMRAFVGNQIKIDKGNVKGKFTSNEFESGVVDESESNKRRSYADVVKGR